jgi:hypothetical protein
MTASVMHLSAAMTLLGTVKKVRLDGSIWRIRGLKRGAFPDHPAKPESAPFILGYWVAR